MAHYQQLKFIELSKQQFPDFFRGKNVIEIGSWDANGSVRSFFSECRYVGVDIAEGKGVDLVHSGQDVNFPDNEFDVAISCECFEHNAFWKATFLNMCRMLKSGGLFLMSCATLGRREHGTSRTTPDDSLTSKVALSDYYLNLTEKDFRTGIDLDAIFQKFEFFENPYSKDLYLVGIKKSTSSDPELNSKFSALRNQLAEVTTTTGVSKAKACKVKMKWHLRKLIIPILGDKTYRDIQFFFNAMLARKKLS
jgi:SAM-dependent methyltransferase